MPGAWKARSWAPEGDTGRGTAVCGDGGSPGLQAGRKIGKSRGPGGDSVWGLGERERAVKAAERRGARKPRSWARVRRARGPGSRPRAGRGGEEPGAGAGGAGEAPQPPHRPASRGGRAPGGSGARFKAGPRRGKQLRPHPLAPRLPGRVRAGRPLVVASPEAAQTARPAKGPRTRGAPAGAALACAGEAPAGPAARRLCGPLRAAL